MPFCHLIDQEAAKEEKQGETSEGVCYWSKTLHSGCVLRQDNDMKKDRLVNHSHAHHFIRVTARGGGARSTTWGWSQPTMMVGGRQRAAEESEGVSGLT